MASERVAQILIRLSQVLRATKSRRRIRRVVWPVTGHRDGIAADRAGSAREHEQTRADRIGPVGLITVQAIKGDLALRNEAR